jgi:hypothetical protein
MVLLLVLEEVEGLTIIFQVKLVIQMQVMVLLLEAPLEMVQQTLVEVEVEVVIVIRVHTLEEMVVLE